MNRTICAKTGRKPPTRRTACTFELPFGFLCQVDLSEKPVIANSTCLLAECLKDIRFAILLMGPSLPPMRFRLEQSKAFLIARCRTASRHCPFSELQPSIFVVIPLPVLLSPQSFSKPTTNA